MSESISPSQKVWAFDLGKGSLGLAVRDGTRFLEKESFLIDQDYAETKTLATKRRQFRTREAHHAREKWLDTLWVGSNLEILKCNGLLWGVKSKPAMLPLLLFWTILFLCSIPMSMIEALSCIGRS
jgi:hypothetical protein